MIIPKNGVIARGSLFHPTRNVLFRQNDNILQNTFPTYKT